MIIFLGLVHILSSNSNLFLVSGTPELLCLVKLGLSLKLDPQFLQQYNLANLSILVT